MAEKYIPQIGDTFVAINKETGIEARVGELECVKQSEHAIEGVDRYIYSCHEWRFKRIKKAPRILSKGLK